MLDPLSALGVAGNVLQVIAFGYQLVADGNQIYHSSTGALKEKIAADELAQDLEGLTKRLAESQDDWTNAQGNLSLEPDEVHLRNVCERCTEIAIELQRQFHKLGSEDGGKRRRLQSYKQALGSIWRKDHIDAIATRLARYQQELDTHILIGIRKSVRESEWKNSENFASLERQTQQLTVAVLEGDGRIDSRLNDQTEVLSQIYEQTSRILSSLVESKKPTSPPFADTTPASDLALPLHEAAHVGDSLKLFILQVQRKCTAEVAQRLLDRTINKNVEDNGGRTALHCAVLKRRLEVIKTLLDTGLDSSIKDDTGKTALFYAQRSPTALWLLTYGPDTNVKAGIDSCDTGLLHMARLVDMEGVQFFLKQGVNVNVQNALGETALTKAARFGSIDVVNALFKAGASIELAADGKWTPLLLAVGTNRIEVVHLLLRLGASKEAKLKNGNTPLVEACLRGHFELVEMLVRSGCNVEVADHINISPLHLAVKADRIKLVEVLLERGVKVDSLDHDRATPLFLAARVGSMEALKILLERGANPKITSPQGCTALGAACLEGRHDCTRLLLDHGVKINDYFKTEEGFNLTPLGAAAHLGDTRMIGLLIDRVASIETHIRRGKTALSIPASYRQNAAISLLLGRGNDLRQRLFDRAESNLEDLTPLMIAAMEGHESSAGLLLELGAEVDAKNAEGATALHYAAIHGSSDVVTILICSGADINIKTETGATALMRAASRGRAEVVCKLLEANANVKLRDRSGCTAWNIAVSENHDRELEHLLKPDPDEHQTLLHLQRGKTPDEIAAYMHEVYQ